MKLYFSSEALQALMEDNQLVEVKSRSSPAEIRRKWLIEQAELKKKLQMVYIYIYIYIFQSIHLHLYLQYERYDER